MRASFIATFLCLGLAACSKSEQPAPAPAPAAAPAKAPAAPQSPPGPSVEDSTFKLSLVSEPEYTAGSPSKLKLVLEARGNYHVNQDYPIKVDLTAAGVTLPKPSLGKPDAAEFGEKIARFEVPFTAPAGAHELSADVDFAVCTPETCVPDQRKVAIKLAVK
jgi:glucose/arabinose dehydrogenase